LDVGVLREPLELGELILGKRLGRVDVERARGGILRDRVDDRQVVAEGLAACGWRNYHGVFPGVRGLKRVGLMRVQREDSAAAQRRRDPGGAPSGELRGARPARRKAAG